MGLRKKPTHMVVDKDFFEKLFEPSRRNIEKKLGIRLTQPSFTRMLFKSKINLTPKLNFDFKEDSQLKKLKIKIQPKKIKPKKRKKSTSRG